METFSKRFERKIAGIRYYLGPSKFNKKRLEEEIKKEKEDFLHKIRAESHRRSHIFSLPGPHRKDYYDINKFIDAYI